MMKWNIEWSEGLEGNIRLGYIIHPEPWAQTGAAITFTEIHRALSPPPYMNNYNRTGGFKLST